MLFVVKMSAPRSPLGGDAWIFRASSPRCARGGWSGERGVSICHVDIPWLPILLYLLFLGGWIYGNSKNN